MPTAHRKHDEASLSKQQLAHWQRFAIDTWNPVSMAFGLWNAQLPGVLTAVGLEYSDFVMRRLKEDAELPLRLAGSRTPEEFWDNYAGFWSKLATDYRKEWETLAKIGNERTQQSFDLLKTAVAPGDEENARGPPQ